jgi:hypothetical protein
MTSPPHTNGFHSGEEANGEQARPPVSRSNAKTLHHQVAEVHRLVDHAMENLEQVQRALRYINKDL